MEEIINSFFLNTLDYDEYIHSKETIKILKSISAEKKGLNMILYGNDGTGKKSLTKTFLYDFYKNIKLKIDNYEYKHNSRRYNFLFYSNKNIKLVDIKLIQHQKYIIDFLDDIKNENNTFMKYSEKHIVIKNSQLLEKNTFSSLRPLIEKLNKKQIYIIFLTNNISKFIDAIKSRCIILRLTHIQQKEIKEIFHTFNIKLTKYYEKKLYKEFQPNIKKIIINGIKYEILKEKVTTNNNLKKIEKIIELLKKNKYLENITDILYKIIRENKIEQFLEDFLNYFLENDKYKKKENYIELFSEVDTNIIKSSNPIYVLQNMMVKLKEYISKDN